MPEQSTRIPFNRPTMTGAEGRYLQEVFDSGVFSGDGPMASRCSDWLENHFACPRVLLTTSCTAALEMAAALCDLAPGDEVILPSFSFCSTGSGFVRAGARLVFVDVRPGTMNLDPAAVEQAVTPRTRAIVAVHYGGVPCDMHALHEVADSHSLILIEDAAQAMFSQYRDRPAGSWSTFSCISFHQSKNLHCGKGGALVVNDEKFVRRAETLLEMGTNRMELMRGNVKEYTWLDIGSSYALSDVNAAFLLAQLEAGEGVTSQRVKTWEHYYTALAPLRDAGRIELPELRDVMGHNGHLFWIKLADGDERARMIDHLAARDISALSHFVPLHSSPAGRRYGRFSGDDRFTTRDAARLLRLPIYQGFSAIDRVAEAVAGYFAQGR